MDRLARDRLRWPLLVALLLLFVVAPPQAEAKRVLRWAAKTRVVQAAGNQAIRSGSSPVPSTLTTIAYCT